MADPLASHKTGGGYRNDADTVNNHVVVARALTKGERYDGDTETFIAAPLSHGSNPNSNAAEGTAKTPSADAEGRVRLRDPGMAIGEDGDPAFTLSAASPGAVASASVRRLTPVECERLQALPDGWTQLGDTADSKRYAALGDAVTASVSEWIGARLIGALN